MGFLIIDLASNEHYLHINMWNWHAIVEVIASFDVIEKEKCDNLNYLGTGGGLSVDEARTIGRLIQTEVLPTMKRGERLLLNLEITGELDTGKLYKDNWDENYGASYEWLEKFALFCLSCDGLRVS